MSETPVIEIVIRGPQGAGKSTVAAAIREMLAEANITAKVVGEAPIDDAIEQLYDLRGRACALISTEQRPTGQRRDVAVANTVLDTLRESDVPEVHAIVLALRIVAAISKIEQR